MNDVDGVVSINNNKEENNPVESCSDKPRILQNMENGTHSRTYYLSMVYYTDRVKWSKRTRSRRSFVCAPRAIEKLT